MLKRLAFVGLLTLLALLLVACGRGDDDPTATPVPTTAPAATQEPPAMSTWAPTGPMSTTGVSAATATTTSAPEATATAEEPSPTVEPTETATVEPSPTATTAGPPTATTQAVAPTNAVAFREVDAWVGDWFSFAKMRIGPDGSLYINDFVPREIHVYAPDGQKQRTISYADVVPEQMSATNDFTIAADGRLFVLDLSFPDTGIVVIEPDGTTMNRWSHGVDPNDPASLVGVAAIAAAENGDLYAVGMRTQRFTADGDLVGVWATFESNMFPMVPLDLIAVDGGLLLSVAGYQGHPAVLIPMDLDGGMSGPPLIVPSPDGVPVYPSMVAVGQDGTSFVLDSFSRRVIALTASGELAAVLELEPFPGQPAAAIAIAVDDGGRLYVADDMTKSVSIFERVAVD